MTDVVVCFDVDDHGVMTDSAEGRAFLIVVRVCQFQGLLGCRWLAQAARDLVGEMDGDERYVRERHPASFGALKLLRVDVAVHDRGFRVVGAFRDQGFCVVGAFHDQGFRVVGAFRDQGFRVVGAVCSQGFRVVGDDVECSSC